MTGRKPPAEFLDSAGGFLLQSGKTVPHPMRRPVRRSAVQRTQGVHNTMVGGRGRSNCGYVIPAALGKELRPAEAASKAGLIS